MAFRWLFARTRSIFVPSRRHLISISHITLKWTRTLKVNRDDSTLETRVGTPRGSGRPCSLGCRATSSPALHWGTSPTHNWYCSWLNLEKQDVYTLYILNVYKWKYSNDCKKKYFYGKNKTSSHNGWGQALSEHWCSYRQGYWAGSGATRGS